MKNYLKNPSLLFLFITLLGCSQPDSPLVVLPVASAPCVTTNTAFQQLYNPLNTTAFPESQAGYASYITHEYTFNSATAATICSVGYQSQPTLETLNYQIEIFDTVSNAVVSTLTATFSATATSYRALSTPLLLVANRSYKIRRISPATSASPNGAGRCVSNTISGSGNVSFPKTSGNLTITGSNFYSNGVSGGANSGLAYIDIVFE